MVPTNVPPSFHLLAKPTGAVCNLNCTYCFFLTKEKLYPGSRFRMTDELLEEYIRQYIDAQQIPEVTIAWQGGEPTLMGVDFFKKTIEYQQIYKKPHMTFQNTMQTNGVLLDDEWCQFFKENNFLIGISIDGPKELHDAYRVDKGGKGSFDRVMRGLHYLQKHNVDFNILTTVHAANGDYPLEVYRFFRDEIGAKFFQFIPIVERENETGYQEGNTVTDRTVKAKQYGNFLNAIFDEWVYHDVGDVFVQIHDVSLGAWLGRPPSLCIFSPTCGNSMAMEHNGDMYSCDHFVEPRYFLGNIREEPMINLVGSEKQRKFGQEKQDSLPNYCLECAVCFACNGGCPKNRFIETPDGEHGLNYLCEGYKTFFNHIDRPMRIMAALLRQNREAGDIMQILAAEKFLDRE
ncbi:MAG: anaerobic sulfatase maturase [Anaerolineales bacterium]